MISYASKTYNSLRFPNLKFKTNQAESNHGDRIYSLITAFNCLHWSHNLCDVFKNCFKALKQGGRFIGVTYPKESVYWNMFVEVLSRTRWQKYLSLSPILYWLDSTDYSRLAIDSGFDTQLFKVDEPAISYCSRKELSDYIEGWLSCMLPLPKNKQANFLEEVLDYAESQFSYKSSIKIPYTKLTYCFVKK